MTSRQPITIERTVDEFGNEEYHCVITDDDTGYPVDFTEFGYQSKDILSSLNHKIPPPYKIHLNRGIFYYIVPVNDEEEMWLKLKGINYTTRENMNKFLQMVDEINREIENDIS